MREVDRGVGDGLVLIVERPENPVADQAQGIGPREATVDRVELVLLEVILAGNSRRDISPDLVFQILPFDRVRGVVTQNAAH